MHAFMDNISGALKSQYRSLIHMCLHFLNINISEDIYWGKTFRFAIVIALYVSINLSSSFCNIPKTAVLKIL